MLTVTTPRKFYDALKAVYGQQSSGISALLGFDGSVLITEREKILDRWTVYFNSVLNQPSTITDEAIVRLSQVETNVALNVSPTMT